LIVYEKKFIRIAEGWHGAGPPDAGVDLVRYLQRAEPMENMSCREFYTIILDLHRSDEDLFGHMRRKTRYEIRRAIEKDKFGFEQWNGEQPEALAEFCGRYDIFAKQRNLARLDRSWLRSTAPDLIVTRVAESTGGDLTWHLYFSTNGRATLLYSVSFYRSLAAKADRQRAGRANRFHHWKDILYFRNAGDSVYDLGGWYEGDSDVSLLRINRFKKEFGGRVVRNYICESAETLKGKLFLGARRVLAGV
jgi:hypothetical protein